MKRYVFQVNMHFGLRQISALSTTRLPTGRYLLTCGPNLPTILRKIKAKSGLKLEQIALEFQPE